MAVLTILPAAALISPATDGDFTAGMEVVFQNVGPTTVYVGKSPNVTADTSATGGVQLVPASGGTPGGTLSVTLPTLRSQVYAVVKSSDVSGLLAVLDAGA